MSSYFPSDFLDSIPDLDISAYGASCESKQAKRPTVLLEKDKKPFAKVVYDEKRSIDGTDVHWLHMIPCTQEPLYFANDQNQDHTAEILKLMLSQAAEMLGYDGKTKGIGFTVPFKSERYNPTLIILLDFAGNVLTDNSKYAHKAYIKDLEQKRKKERDEIDGRLRNEERMEYHYKYKH